MRNAFGWNAELLRQAAALADAILAAVVGEDQLALLSPMPARPRRRWWSPPAGLVELVEFHRRNRQRVAKRSQILAGRCVAPQVLAVEQEGDAVEVGSRGWPDRPVPPRAALRNPVEDLVGQLLRRLAAAEGEERHQALADLFVASPCASPSGPSNAQQQGEALRGEVVALRRTARLERRGRGVRGKELLDAEPKLILPMSISGCRAMCAALWSASSRPTWGRKATPCRKRVLGKRGERR